MNSGVFSNLSTERLRLRPLNLSDENDIFRLRSDEIINYFISRKRLTNKDEAIQFINRINNQIKEGVILYWAIMLKENPPLIGTICLWNFSKERKTAELGYELFPEFQGKGIMDEAVKKVIETAFKKMGFAIIEAFTHKDNFKSRSLLLRNNFFDDSSRKDEDNDNNAIFILQK